MQHTVSSKAQPCVQRAKGSKRALVVAAAVFAGLLAGAGSTLPDGRPTPTGLDVPRWISLKSSRVRARSGPGLDHRILWEYRAAGLPVQVVAETREWRKICDLEGNVAWIHRTVASSRRHIVNLSEDALPLHVRPRTDSPVRALLAARAMTSLEVCEDGWCRVRARRVRGWTPQSALFGTAERPLCDANRPAGPAQTRARDNG